MQRTITLIALAAALLLLALGTAAGQEPSPLATATPMVQIVVVTATPGATVTPVVQVVVVTATPGPTATPTPVPSQIPWWVGVIPGGVVSLASALLTMWIQHRMRLAALAAQAKHYPLQVIYDKQLEFFDKSVPLLDRVSKYLGFIPVRFGWQTPDPEKREDAAIAVDEFGELIMKYHMYLPEKLLCEARELYAACLPLQGSPTQQFQEVLDCCIGKLFSFQCSLREFARIESLASDLELSHGTRRISGNATKDPPR